MADYSDDSFSQSWYLYGDSPRNYSPALVGSRGGLGADDLWPSESRGNGNVRKNNARTGGAQGKGTLLRKAPCRLCGFINDLTAIDHTGGSIDGEGAAGGIATATVSFPVSGPPSILGQTVTATENIGTQSVRKNAGCALCFSKDSTHLRVIFDRPDPLNTPLTLGF